MSPREAIVRANGVDLWTARGGTGPPIVLCHGGPGGYDNLWPLAARLDDAATVYRYDQRGSLRSESAPPYDVPTFVADLEGIREHYAVEEWVVGGHSWGASLAVAYALEHPDRTSGLVCLSPFLCLDDGDWKERYHDAVAERLSADERLADLEARLEADDLEGDLAAVRAEKARLTLRADLVDDAAPSPVSPHAFAYAVNEALNADWERFTAERDLCGALGGLDVPALVLVGENDPRPRACAEGLADATGGEFVALNGAGHFPWIERPDAVAEALRSFLAAG